MKSFLQRRKWTKRPASWVYSSRKSPYLMFPHTVMLMNAVLVYPPCVFKADFEKQTQI